MQQESAAPRKEKPDQARQTCPTCHALVQDGDIICVACGTNLLTGQRLTGTAKPAPPARKMNIWIIAVAIVVVLGLLSVGFALLVASRNDLDQAIQLIVTGHLSEANQLLEQYVRENPNDARAYFELGKLQWRTRQWPKAADSFERAAEANPRNRAAFLLAVASMAQAGTERARGREIRLLERFVEQYPRDEMGWYLLGLAKGAQGNVPDQIEALNEALALDPSDGARRQYYGIALALNGKYGEAVSEFEAALAQYPEDGDILAAMGLAAHLGDNSENAVSLLLDAVDNQTVIEDAVLLELGLLYMQEGQFDEATTYLSRVLARDETNGTALFFLATCLQVQGLESDALSEYENIMAGRGPFAGKAAIRAAEIYLKREDASAADRALDLAEEFKEQDAAWYTLRGRLHAKEGDPDVAQEMFRTAIAKDPRYAPAHLENGLQYVKRRVFSEGIRELERYLEYVDPGAKGARVDETRALIAQLKQADTMGSASRTAGL